MLTAIPGLASTIAATGTGTQTAAAIGGSSWLSDLVFGAGDLLSGVGGLGELGGMFGSGGIETDLDYALATGQLTSGNFEVGMSKNKIILIGLLVLIGLLIWVKR